MNINDVNNNLADIADRYRSDSFLCRVRKMFRGLREPKDSKEYKEALIETQRLSAPVCAIVFPVLAVLLLIVCSTDKNADREMHDPVTILPNEEVPILTEPPEPEEKVPEKNQPIDPGDIDFKLSDPDLTAKEAPNELPPVNSVAIIPNFREGPKIAWGPSGMGDRGKRVKGYSGVPSEKNVKLALRWLKKNQNQDGSWNNNRCAMTGLAVLTFLAHGEKPGSSPEFGDTVHKGLEFLMNGQDQRTGLFGHQDGHQYSHPIAAYAMCEAYGMTLHPNVKRSAELALMPIIKGQHPTGGWTYRMDPGIDKASGKYRDDTSYMGWCAQALKAAKLAGLKADGLDRAVKLAVKGFKKNSDPDGGFGYTGPSGTHGLTSVGALCMELLGARDDSSVRKSLAVMDQWSIGDFGRENKVGKSPQYYFYYATQSKFNNGGKSWKLWNDEMVQSYAAAQKTQSGVYRDHLGESHDIGWWENGDAHSDRPVMDTCLASLQLMVYYRNLPTTMAKAFHVEPEVMAFVDDPDDIKVKEEDLL